jgi:REP element-mobilizing transposase RayT
MPRRPRSQLPDGIYHVTSRGNAGAALFTDDVDRNVFMALFRHCVRRHGWRCHAYCLMSTHYHLVLEAERSHLSAGMRLLNGVYAQRFNDRHDRSGHVFEGRFRVWVVTDKAHLAATCQYVLANPVQAGACPAVGEWPWSGLSLPPLRRAAA